ncbi:MAG TPA: ABC transporter substrate-binding protein [Acidimicrobiia bacterium]|nr:ABC transporter substrate-binding protein [Acidimicrobiia bacterium]
MASRRLFVLLTAGALASAACGGSAAQRAALKVQSQNLAGGANAAASGGGGYSSGDAGASAAPAEGAATSDGAGSSTGAGAASSGAATPVGGSSTATKSGSAAAPGTKTASGSSGGASTPAAGSTSGKLNPGSGSAGATPGTPTPGGPAPGSSAVGGATDVGVTANSIKVGHIGIYSGPVGSFGDDLSYAGRAKLQEINDSGGINGRKLDVLVRDDAWDGTKGMNAARDLVEREHIFAFCCIMSVNTSDPLTPYADEHKIPHIGADGWGEPQYKGAWTFPVSASAVVEAHMLAKYQAEKQGAKRVAVIYINNPTGRAYVKAYDEVIKKFGGEVVFSQPATFDDPGTTTFIAQARTQNIDTISTYLDPGIFTRLVREAAAQNYKPKNAFSGAAGLYFQVTPNFTGPNGEGTIAATHWVTNDMDTPGYRAYKAVVEKYYPKIDHSTWTKAGFVGATVFGNALKSLGLEVTRQRLKDTVDTLSNFETGLGPNISFSPGHHRANKTIYLAQIQRSGDKFEFKYIAGPLVDEYAETN